MDSDSDSAVVPVEVSYPQYDGDDEVFSPILPKEKKDHTLSFLNYDFLIHVVTYVFGFLLGILGSVSDHAVVPVIVLIVGFIAMIGIRFACSYFGISFKGHIIK